MNPGLIKNYVAEGAVTKRRIVMHGTADGQAALADGSTAKLLGVSTDIDSADTARVDVQLSGQVEIEFGGTVARGDWLTSDATGRAVAAAPGAGVNAEVIGKADVSGVIGDVASVNLSLGQIQG